MIMHVEIKTPAVKIELDRLYAEIFCKMVFLQFTDTKKPDIYFLSAVYLFNKLRTKLHQRTIKIKLPLEYAILLKQYCEITPGVNGLQQAATYIIYEQIDKKL